MSNTDTNPESTSQTITAQRGNSQAIAFARKGGVALSALLGSIATRKEEERRGPIEMFLFLTEHYTDDEVTRIPVVGSKQGETGNLPYDKYTSELQTKDGKKKVPGSWFTDVIRATDEYDAIIQRKAYCDDVTLAGCPDDIKAMGTGERATEKQRLTDRVKDMRTGLTKGAMLYHHVKEIEELNPERIRIRMPFLKTKRADGSDGLKVMGNTVRLQDPAGIKEDVVFSVSQFNALRPAKLPHVPDATNPDKLDKSGWDITALESTAERAPKNSGAGKQDKNKIAVPTTVEGILNLFNVMGTALDTNTDQGKMLHSKVLSACAAPGEKGDDTVETIGDFVIRIDDDIWTVINARYNGIKTKKNQARNQKAALQSRG